MTDFTVEGLRGAAEALTNVLRGGLLPSPPPESLGLDTTDEAEAESGGIGSDNTGGGEPAAYTGGGDVTARFLAAIREHESGNNYTAHNPNGSASGAYQFIDSTWGGYGGYSSASAAPASVQDAKAREYLAQIQAISDDPRVWAAYWFYPAEAVKLARGEGSWGYAPAPEVNNGLTLGTFADRIVGLMG